MGDTSTKSRYFINDWYLGQIFSLYTCYYGFICEREQALYGIKCVLRIFWQTRLFEIHRKSQRPAILPSMQVRVSDKIFCLCILFCTGNRKCNWYAGTNDHGQLGITFYFKWHLLLKHATVSMVMLLIIVFL